MSDLARAVLQFACEATIYTCERILETLEARRPDHGDPLPGRMECDGPMAADSMPATTSTLACDPSREHIWVGRGGIEWSADPDVKHGWIGWHDNLPQPIRIHPDQATDPYGPFYRREFTYPDWLNGGLR